MVPYVWIGIKMFVKDKHSSLFSDEEKKVFIEIVTRLYS